MKNSSIDNTKDYFQWTFDPFFPTYTGTFLPQIHFHKTSRFTEKDKKFATKINLKEHDEIFNDIPNSLDVGRYHSWIVKSPLPDDLIITSVDHNNQIMSLKHIKYPIRGVQFHPESVLTPYGKAIIKNWLETLWKKF